MRLKEVRLLKKQSKQTYKNKNGKEVHFYNYYLESDNGKRIQIKCAFKEQTQLLDMIADYER